MVEFRCVMPNTIDAKSANTPAAESAISSIKVHASSSACDAHPPPDKVQQAGAIRKVLP